MILTGQRCMILTGQRCVKWLITPWVMVMRLWVVVVVVVVWVLLQTQLQQTQQRLDAALEQHKQVRLGGDEGVWRVWRECTTHKRVPPVRSVDDGRMSWCIQA